MDVRVFNPFEKQYGQRVRDIEHASLVMSATGGMANQATVFLQKAMASTKSIGIAEHSPG